MWVPDVRHEAMRDLVRAPLDAVDSPRRARQQLWGFLLRRGCHYGRPDWTKLHRRWLKFEQAVHHLVLEDYVQAVEAAAARRDRLTAQIAAMLPDWTLAPVVAALQTMRGMALVNAASLIAELGDLARFANPRQLMAHLGLVPSEHSSGASIRRRHNKTKLCRTGGRAGRAQDQRGVKVAPRRRPGAVATPAPGGLLHCPGHGSFGRTLTSEPCRLVIGAAERLVRNQPIGCLEKRRRHGHRANSDAAATSALPMTGPGSKKKNKVTNAVTTSTPFSSPAIGWSKAPVGSSKYMTLTMRK